MLDITTKFVYDVAEEAYHEAHSPSKRPIVDAHSGSDREDNRDNDKGNASSTEGSDPQIGAGVLGES